MGRKLKQRDLPWKVKKFMSYLSIHFSVPHITSHTGLIIKP